MTQFFVLIICIVAAMACALVGNFLVLRRLSLMGDAISHAVLPGIIVAFFIVGSLESPLFFIFSLIFAILMTMLIQWVSEHIQVSKESIIGIVFTFLFAFGVILLVRFADQIHLDQDAVLFGHVEFSAWNRLVVAGVDMGPRSLWTMGSVFLANLMAILLFWKELKISSFDPVLSASLGYSPKKMHYLVMILTAITVVAAFEAVGVILVVALLTVPAATAYFLSERLGVMVFLSLVFAVLSSSLGFLLATQLDVSIAGSIAMISGIIFGSTIFFKKVWQGIFR